MSPPTYETLLLSCEAGGVAMCMFNRPDVRNALNLAMVRDLRQVLVDLAAQQETRVLILTGAGGKAFAGGADIAELKERSRQDALRRINNTLMRELEIFPLPTIAAIQGFALGGGLELALACDLRVCGRGARFGQPEVSLGIIPGAGATYRLPRLIGPAAARELVLTGRIINAATAERIGLVNEVVDDAQVMERARALALEIIANGVLAVRMAKAALIANSESDIEAAMTLEAHSQAVLFEDEEKHRRMAAFLSKRRKRSVTP